MTGGAEALPVGGIKEEHAIAPMGHDVIEHGGCPVLVLEGVAVGAEGVLPPVGRALLLPAGVVAPSSSRAPVLVELLAGGVLETPRLVGQGVAPRLSAHAQGASRHRSLALATVR